MYFLFFCRINLIKTRLTVSYVTVKTIKEQTRTNPEQFSKQVSSIVFFIIVLTIRGFLVLKSWLTLSRLMVGKHGRPPDRDMSRGYIAGTSPWDKCETRPRHMLHSISRGYVAGDFPGIYWRTRPRDM